MPSGLRYCRRYIGPCRSRRPGRPRPATRCRALQRLTCSSSTPIACWAGSIARLRRLGLYDRALFTVLADHGRSHYLATRDGWSSPLEIAPERSSASRSSSSCPASGVANDHRQARCGRSTSCRRSPTCSGFHIPWQVDGSSLLGRPSNAERANRYMNYRHFDVRLPPATVRRGFLAALAVRNRLFGHGNIFTFGMPAAHDCERQSPPAPAGSIIRLDSPRRHDLRPGPRRTRTSAMRPPPCTGRSSILARPSATD